MSSTPPPGPPLGTPSTPIPPPRPRNEKDEKDEKGRQEDEKQHEKDEKEHGEKWRRDPLGAIAWACILIWAGVVLLGNNLNLIPAIPGLPMGQWTWIFLGAGCILLLEALVRLLMPEHRKGVIGSVIVGFIFLGIALGDSFGWGVIWGLLLVAIGVVVLLGGILRR